MLALVGLLCGGVAAAWFGAKKDESSAPPTQSAVEGELPKKAENSSTLPEDRTETGQDSSEVSERDGTESQQARSNPLPSAAPTQIHRAAAGNIVANWTDIDHPLANGNPEAVLFAMPNWNPGGVGGTYNDHPVRVLYDQRVGRWVVFNEDLASMPESASFNVLMR